MAGRSGGRDGAPPAAVALLARALAGLDLVSAATVVGTMAVMVAIVSLQVLLRYGFNESLDSADELSRLAFVWAIFLAVPHAVKRGAHVGIDLVVARLPGPLRAGLFRATSALGALLMATAAGQAVVVARDTWDQLLPTLDASSGFFYVAVAVGCAHSVLHLVRLTVRGPALREAAEAA